MPCQMPPAFDIAEAASGSSKSTTSMSSPTAMPSSMVPMTVPVNSWGVVPLNTLSAVRVSPSASVETSTGAAQSFAGAD